MQTILVPLDGSPMAEQGLTSARRLAKQTGAALSLVRGVPFFATDTRIEDADRAAVREAREYLSTVQDNLTREGFTARMDVVPSDPVAAILFAAEMQAANLISICTHGRSGLRHVLLGSVAEAVLRRSRAPILITRAQEKPAEAANTPYRRILAPLDGTSFAEAALAYLEREQIGDEAELILLQVVAPVTPPYVPGLMGNGAAQLYTDADHQTQQHLQDAEVYLNATGAAHHSRGAWRTRAVLGAPAAEILAAAKSENVDLIVLVTHGRHGLDRLMYGSVARELLHHAEIPVLILPGDEDHGTPKRVS